MERQEVINRFENLKINNEDFYIRHPNLLNTLNAKIEGLKLGCDYKIEDGGWVVGYVWGNSVGCQMIDDTTTLDDVKHQKMSVDLAKDIYRTKFKLDN
ncbi:MAG: hypothetical protein RR359_04415 [Bacilli bacterium]